jgi:hypothetical protein
MGKDRSPEPLDKSPQHEGKYADAGVEPVQADIEHLCKVWAEVGRAILLRRKQNGEAVQNEDS